MGNLCCTTRPKIDKIEKKKSGKKSIKSKITTATETIRKSFKKQHKLGSMKKKNKNLQGFEETVTTERCNGHPIIVKSQSEVDDDNILEKNSSQITTVAQIHSHVSIDESDGNFFTEAELNEKMTIQHQIIIPEGAECSIQIEAVVVEDNCEEENFGNHDTGDFVDSEIYINQEITNEDEFQHELENVMEEDEDENEKNISTTTAEIINFINKDKVSTNYITEEFICYEKSNLIKSEENIISISEEDKHDEMITIIEEDSFILNEVEAEKSEEKTQISEHQKDNVESKEVESNEISNSTDNDSKRISNYSNLIDSSASYDGGVSEISSNEVGYETFMWWK